MLYCAVATPLRPQRILWTGAHQTELGAKVIGGVRGRVGDRRLSKHFRETLSWKGASSLTMACVEIVHELDKRLRLRILSDADDFAQTEVALRQLPGVASVRANRACASLTLAYDGQPEVRDSILETARRTPSAAADIMAASASR